jgi:cell division septation protein DedD
MLFTTIRAAILFLAALAIMPGCSQPKQQPDADFVTAFEQHKYAEAYDTAAAAATRLKGPDRDRAALIAGQSAQAVNRNDDARMWLEPLLDNPDSAVAGRAGATLGLVALEQGQNARAAELLDAASRKLSDDEAARSAMYSGDALRNLNQGARARESYVRAQAMVKTDADLRTLISERLSGTTTIAAPAPGKGRYSVQVGAFGSPSRAGEAAVKYGRFGSTRVVRSSVNGQNFHKVRIGSFSSRAEAETLKRKIGAEARVVETNDE